VKPFVVTWSVAIFRALREVMPLRVLRLRVIPIFSRAFAENEEANDFVIELWTVANLVISVAFMILSFSRGGFWWAASLWGFCRVVEIVVVLINVLLIDWYRVGRQNQSKQPYSLVGYLRAVVLLLLNFAEVVIWFAIKYGTLLWENPAQDLIRADWFDSLSLSIVSMTTFGHTDLSPIGFGEVFTLLQAGIGLFMLSAVLARFISLLPEPGTRDPAEKAMSRQGSEES
jgi:hypothetical protein